MIRGARRLAGLRSWRPFAGPFPAAVLLATMNPASVPLRRAIAPSRTPGSPSMRPRSIVWLWLCCLALLPACRTYYSAYAVGADETTLLERERDGRRETFQLVGLNGVGRASLRVITEQERDRPYLGMKLGELDKASAERRGVAPYTGLLVHEVVPGSAAGEAGVLAGDVLLAIDGTETVYLEQFERLQAGLAVDRPVAARLLRGQTPQGASIPVRTVRERVRDSADMPLDPPTASERRYAGAELRGIPASWCERIFDTPRQAVVVTSVEVGSPAWLGGGRTGDVIDEVDGQPVPTAAQLSSRIAEAGARGARMTWKLRTGPDTHHDATLDLHDYSGEAHVTIPILFDLENGVYEDRWSVGLGLLLHNRNHYVAESRTREPQTRNVFQALLGLLRVETKPGETEVRLLWLIRFDT